MRKHNAVAAAKCSRHGARLPARARRAAILDARAVRRAAGRARSRRAVEAAKKEGKVVCTPRSTCRSPRRSPRRSRRNIPASRCGSSAPAPSACSSASARNTPATSTRSTSSTPPTPRISSSGSARACSRLRAGGRRQDSIRPSTTTRTACSPASACYLSLDRLQHQSGEAGRRAEELHRPARSEMEGQDRQGASRLQRHDHDRDLPDARAISAGTISRSSPRRTSCRCSPSTDPPKRLALGERAIMADGNEYNHLPDQGDGRAGRDRLSRPRARR